MSKAKKHTNNNLEKENKINNSIKKHSIKVIIIIGVLLLAGILSVAIFKLINNKPTLKEVSVNEVTSKLEDGSYYIFGVEKDKTFKVEKRDNFSYEVLDEDNKKVEVETTEKDNKVTLKAKDSYIEGKTYTLKITNGNFVDEELKDAQVVIFNIKRPSKQLVTIKEEVIKKSNEEIKVKEEKDNKITLETKENYKKDKIVLVDEKAAYKIEKCKNNVCTASIPTLEDVYSELDYYGSQELDLSNFVSDDDFKNNLKNNIDKNLVGMLVPDANAATKTTLELKYDKKHKELVATVKISTDPKDKLFGNKFLDNHSFSTQFELGIKITAYEDISFKYQDIGLVITLRADMGVIVSHPAFANFKEEFEELFNDDKLVDIRDYVKNAKKDSVKTANDIGKMSVPTGIAGLNVICNAGYLFNFDLKADISADAKNTMTTTIGFNTKQGLYGNVKNKPSASSKFMGEGEVKFGFQGEAGASILNIVDIVGKIEVGGYNSGSLSIENAMSEDTKTIISSIGEAGLFATVKAEAKTALVTATVIIYDDKFKLIDTSESIDIKTIKSAQEKPVSKEEPQKQEEDEPTINNSNDNINDNKPTYRFTKEEVRAKLEKNYKNIIQDGFYGGYNGATTTVGYFFIYKTFNTSSNILSYQWKFHDSDNTIVNSYTCDYNYVNDTMSCNNYANAKNYFIKECQFDFTNPLIDQYYDPSDVGKCINWYIEPEQNIKERISGEFKKVLAASELTTEDLGVLK